MKWEDVESNWINFKETIKDTWSDLTDEDLDQIQGNRVELEQRLIERYGKSQEEAQTEIDQWLNVARLKGRL